MFFVINEAWKKEVFGSPYFKLCRKQQHTAAVLKRWNETFGFCQSRINDLNSRLEKIQFEPQSEANMALEARI
jgi:hypothetical protein